MSTKEKVGIMERRRALETARNILYSKVGKVVLDDNKFPDRTLDMTVKRIDNEARKNQTLIENDKRMFKRNRLIYNLEPTILMERPASPPHPRKTVETEATPHYMTDIKNEQPIYVPNMPPTIDAFTIVKRKTKNIWENSYTEEDMTRQFRSIVMQSPPLNVSEQTELDKGYNQYRPPSKNQEDAKKRIEEKRRQKIQLLREAQRTPSPDPVLAFITQLDNEAQSRSSRRTYSRRSRISSTAASRNANSATELEFNPRHLEIFEKIRGRQKVKFFSTMKIMEE